jgi:hypothetical protein
MKIRKSRTKVLLHWPQYNNVMKLFRVINYALMQQAAVFDEHIFILVQYLNVCPGLGANPRSLGYFGLFSLT